MSYAFPWVEPPWPDKVLPHNKLEDRIAQVISSLNMCVLSTFGKNGPMASPIEYHAEGLEIFIPARPRNTEAQGDAEGSAYLLCGPPSLSWLAIGPRCPGVRQKPKSSNHMLRAGTTA